MPGHTAPALTSLPPPTLPCRPQPVVWSFMVSWPDPKPSCFRMASLPKQGPGTLSCPQHLPGLPAILGAQPHGALVSLRVHAEKVLEAAPCEGASAGAAQGSPVHWAGTTRPAGSEGACQGQEAWFLLLLRTGCLSSGLLGARGLLICGRQRSQSLFLPARPKTWSLPLGTSLPSLQMPRVLALTTHMVPSHQFRT